MVPLKFQSSNTPYVTNEEALAIYDKHTSDPVTVQMNAFREEMIKIAAIVEAVNKPLEENPLSLMPSGP